MSISTLPWQFDPKTGEITDGGWLHAMVAQGVGPDDAALIVRAVNAHEAHQEHVALCTGILECLDQGDVWKKPARLHAAGLLRKALEKVGKA